MPIYRISSQRNTIQAFYEEMKNSDERITKNIGKSMLDLIGCLDEYFPISKIWCFDLPFKYLVERNDWKSAWLIKIISNREIFVIEYENNDKQHRIEFVEKEKFLDELFLLMKIETVWSNNQELARAIEIRKEK